MLFECLKKWEMLHTTEKAAGIQLVLHTSCVNYTCEDLKRTAELGYEWVAPDDVCRELRLLRSSRIYRNQAKMLLDRINRYNSKYRPWNMTQLYKKTTGSAASGLYPGTVIYAFGDLNFSDEFLECVSKDVNGYVVIPSINWSCVAGQASIIKLEVAREYSVRQSITLSKSRARARLLEMERLSVNDSNLYISGRDMKMTGKGGSNANIYTSPELPEKMIKGFKGFSLIGTQKAKVKILREFGKRVPFLRTAFPIDLIYDESGNIAAFTMKEIGGKLLREFILNGWEEHDLEKILKRLMLLIIELHCMHVLVNDLSFNNVLIDSDDRVGLVDCDSFQVLNYPGGGMTPLYQHPEIKETDYDSLLRQPRHEAFAFAVLLYQMIFYAEPLSQQQAPEDERNLNWSNSEFPFDTFTFSPNTNTETRKNWLDMDVRIRSAFSDEFHFRREVTLGEWLGILGIVP